MAKDEEMTMNPYVIIGGTLFAAILIYAVIITVKYMALRKAVAQVATKTANPSSSAITAAVNSTLTQANNVSTAATTTTTT